MVSSHVPSRLRPKTPFATDAILVGDPGRALLLAQELLAEPKMSNHARGLWGYSGQTLNGAELTIQATGMGGPSAAVVVTDLAKLGVRRAVRIGTCIGVRAEAQPGELLLVERALAVGGSAAAFGATTGETVRPDPGLRKRLGAELGARARPVQIASLDALHADPDSAPRSVAATDMQSVAVLARARQLEVVAAAVLVVAEDATGRHASEARLESAAKEAGKAAAGVLSQPKVKG